MTLLEHTPDRVAQATKPPALATDRLILRAPRPADAEVVARLVNDRRIAENTSRIPHPYSLADAHEYIAKEELLSAVDVYASMARALLH